MVYYQHGSGTYSWSPTAGLSNPNLLNPVASPSATTVYTLTYIDENGNTASDAVTATVNPLPIVDAGADQTICVGTTASLNAASNVVTGSPAPFEVCLFDVLNLGCSYIAPLPCDVIGYSDPITVSSAPISLNETSINSIDFQFYAGLGFSFFIYVNGVLVDQTGLQTDPDYQPCNTTFYPYNFSVPGYKINPHWNVNGNNTISVANAVSGGNLYYIKANVNYNWSFYSWSGDVADPSSASTTASPSTSTVYAITVTDLNGCSASDDVAVRVEDCSTPTCNLSTSVSGNNLVYYGYQPLACTTLLASATGATGSVSYNWSTGATTASITVCPSDTTVYTVLITDAEGCTATASKAVNVLDVRCGNGNDKVSVCHVPNGDFNHAKTLCLASNAVSHHLANHTSSFVGECYQSKRSGEADEKAITASVEPLIKVFPNPTNGSFKILFADAEKTINRIIITDVRGAVVREFSRTEAVNQWVQETDLNNATAGIYFVHMMNNNQLLQNTKLVKHD